MSSYTRPTISAIVVNFNAGGFLGLCIDRIRKSTPAVELIVVDNHSTDISKVWGLGCNGRQNEKYIQNDRNLGFSAAVNIGASAASGDILVVINPDCLVWPHTIDRLCRLLKDQLEVGLVGGLVFDIHGSEQAGCRRYDVTPMRSIGKMLDKLFPLRNMPTIDMTKEPIPQNNIDVDAVSGSFFAVRKSVYRELGGMDEDYFLHFEDLDFCRRVREAGYRVVFTPDVSAIHLGAVSGGVKSVEIAAYKHHSLKTYFRKHLNRYSLTARAVSIISQLYVWLSCLYELIKPEMRSNQDFDLFEGIGSATNVNEVLVIGAQCRLLYAVVMRLAAGGYVVVVETNDPQTAPRIPGVSWVTSEYTTKVSKKDHPQFGWTLCLSTTERLKVCQQRLSGRMFGSQLLIQTGVEPRAPDQNATIEKSAVTETGVDWFEWGLLGLSLRSTNSGSGNINKSFINKELVRDSDLKEEHRALGQSAQQVHVDDVSELCLDVLASTIEPESGTTSQQILKACIDRFSQRTRPLYN